jgi:hypothetical protein
MDQKKQLLITSSQKSYPPAVHSLDNTCRIVKDNFQQTRLCV